MPKAMIAANLTLLGAPKTPEWATIMGGFGSGRSTGGSRYMTVEQCYSLDLATLAHSGYLAPGMKASGLRQWMTGTTRSLQRRPACLSTSATRPRRRSRFITWPGTSRSKFGGGFSPPGRGMVACGIGSSVLGAGCGAGCSTPTPLSDASGSPAGAARDSATTRTGRVTRSGASGGPRNLYRLSAASRTRRGTRSRNGCGGKPSTGCSSRRTPRRTGQTFLPCTGRDAGVTPGVLPGVRGGAGAGTGGTPGRLTRRPRMRAHLL